MVGFDGLIGCLLWRLFCGVLLRILCESGENRLEVRLLGHAVYWKCDEFLVVVCMPVADHQIVGVLQASEG